MKVKYYYLRNKKNEPVVTKCLVKCEDNCVGVGTALCSFEDNPNKKTGRNIAFSRACNALTSCKHFAPIKREEAYKICVSANDNYYDWKGKFVPPELYGTYLTQYERDIIGV